MSDSSKKIGTAWIQNLRKEEVLEELSTRNISASSELKLDELRRLLRNEVKKEQSEKSSENRESAGEKGGVSRNQNEHESSNNDTPIEALKMEFTAKLDFKLGVDDWEEFMERIDLYFEANDITEEGKMRAILLTKMDAETYSVVKKVCAPKKPKETPLEDIKKKMESYIMPKANRTVLRQDFRRRKQEEKETVTQYLAALRSLSKDCEFSNGDEALLDQFLTGIQNENIKVALFKKEKLTIDEAIKTATAIEGATKAIKKLKPQWLEKHDESVEGAEANIHRIRARGKQRNERDRRSNSSTQGRDHRGKQRSQGDRQQTTRCSCCGKPNHQAQRCWHRNKSCNVCGAKGHLENVCNTKKKGNKSNVNLIKKKILTFGER